MCSCFFHFGKIVGGSSLATMSKSLTEKEDLVNGEINKLTNGHESGNVYKLDLNGLIVLNFLKEQLETSTRWLRGLTTVTLIGFFLMAGFRLNMNFPNSVHSKMSSALQASEKQKQKECPPLPNVPHSSHNCSGFNVADVCTYTCNTGRIMEGNSKIICSKELEWNNPPTCMCPACKVGEDCLLDNSWEKVKKGSGSHIVVSYAGNKIYCSSQKTFSWFPFYEKFKCTCTDAETGLKITSEEKNGATVAYQQALAGLIQLLIKLQKYPETCDKIDPDEDEQNTSNNKVHFSGVFFAICAIVIGVSALRKNLGQKRVPIIINDRETTGSQTNINEEETSVHVHNIRRETGFNLHGVHSENLHCKKCNAVIANLDDIEEISSNKALTSWHKTIGRIKRILIQTFVNPHDYKFMVATFNESRVEAEQRAVQEHSWFDGYEWRISRCPRCNEHLGWKFQPHRHNQSISEDYTFYGLILDKLVVNP